MSMSDDIISIPECPGVYQVRNTVTGDCYIGASANVSVRARSHYYDLRFGRHVCKAMQASFDEHGECMFVFEILDTCDIADLSAREIAWIESAKPAFNKNGGASIIRNPIDMSKYSKKTKQKPIAKKPRNLGLTHSDRKDRRARMAAEVLEGRSIDFVAEKYGVTVSTVRGAFAEFKPSQYRQLKIKRMAFAVEAVRAGKKAVAAAMEYGVSYGALLTECKAASVEVRQGVEPGTPALHCTVVSRQQWQSADWTLRDIELSKILGLSRERVRQVRLLLNRQRSPRHRHRAAAPAA